MRKSRFTETHIVRVLKEVEGGRQMAVDLDRQGFAINVVRHIACAKPAAIEQDVGHEVHGPAWVKSRRQSQGFWMLSGYRLARRLLSVFCPADAYCA